MAFVYEEKVLSNAAPRNGGKQAGGKPGDGPRQWAALMLGGLPMVLGVATLLAVAAFMTCHVAVFQDETWDYPEAIAMIKGTSWVPYYEMKVGHVTLPLVTGPYQGALKSYLAAPVFALLGTSVGVLRGINVFLGFFYLLALAWTLAELINPRAAMLAFLVPLLDPNFTFFTITDQGQFILILGLSALALGAFFRAWRREQWGFIALTLLLTSTVIAVKLTAIPLVVALPLLLAFMLRRGWRQFLRPTRLIVYVLLCLLPAVPNILYFAHEGFGAMRSSTRVDPASIPPYLTAMRNNIGSFFYCMDGSYLFSMSNSGTPETHSWFARAGLCLLALAPLLAWWRRKTGVAFWAQPLVCPVLLIMCMLLQAKVAGLSRPWHSLMIYHATFVLAVFLIVGDLALLLRRYAGRAVAAILVGALALGLIGQAQWGVCRPLVNRIRINGGSETRAMNLYPLHNTLEDLLSKTRNRSRIEVISISYSLTSPLYVLSLGAIKPTDWEFKDFTDGDIKDMTRWLDSGNQWIVYRYNYSPANIKADDFSNKGWKWFKAHGFFDNPQYELIRFDDPKAMTETGILRKNPAAAKPALPAPAPQ